MAGSATAVSDCPADYEEFAADYRDYVVGLVRRQGVPPQDAEDVAHDIMSRLQYRDILAMYDPDKYAEHGGRKVKCTFRNLLSAQVVLYCRGHRERLGKHADRELLIADKPLEEGMPWIDVFGGSCWDDYSALDAEEFIARMRGYLATVPRRSPGDKLNLVELFDELVREAREEGTVSYTKVRHHFGVSSATASSWVGYLRSVMSGASGAPAAPDAVGGVLLAREDIKTAVEVLEAAKGVMVAGPLERAGHPLAKAEKGWYHAFAAEERKRFAEVEVEGRTHRNPAGHVKEAVIHRLRRMLDGTPVPALPEPEPVSLRDYLEAELWKLGADAGAVERCLVLADRMAREAVAC